MQPLNAYYSITFCMMSYSLGSISPGVKTRETHDHINRDLLDHELLDHELLDHDIPDHELLDHVLHLNHYLLNLTINHLSLFMFVNHQPKLDPVLRPNCYQQLYATFKLVYKTVELEYQFPTP